MLPVIDDIDEETFEYVPTEDDHTRGGMDWKLTHRWIAARNVTEGKWIMKRDQIRKHHWFH